MAEIMEELYKSRYTGNVQIESDSCYSGKLCFEAKKEWEKRSQEGIGIYCKSFQVFGSSHKDKKAVWGEYTKMKKEAKKDKQTKEEAIRITEEYEKKYGLTSFKSNTPLDQAPIQEKLPTHHTNTPEEDELLKWSKEYVEYMKLNA